MALQDSNRPPQANNQPRQRGQQQQQQQRGRRGGQQMQDLQNLVHHAPTNEEVQSHASTVFTHETHALDMPQTRVHDAVIKSITEDSAHLSVSLGAQETDQIPQPNVSNLFTESSIMNNDTNPGSLNIEANVAGAADNRQEANKTEGLRSSTDFVLGGSWFSESAESQLSAQVQAANLRMSSNALAGDLANCNTRVGVLETHVSKLEKDIDERLKVAAATVTASKAAKSGINWEAIGKETLTTVCVVGGAFTAISLVAIGLQAVFGDDAIPE